MHSGALTVGICPQPVSSDLDCPMPVLFNRAPLDFVLESNVGSSTQVFHHPWIITAVFLVLCSNIPSLMITIWRSPVLSYDQIYQPIYYLGNICYILPCKKIKFSPLLAHPYFSPSYVEPVSPKWVTLWTSDENIWNMMLSLEVYDTVGEYCYNSLPSTLLRQDPCYHCGSIYPVGFSGGSDNKESNWNVGEPGSIPGLRRCPGKGWGYPLQYSCLENLTDRAAWQAIAHEVTKSQPQLSN